MYDWTMENDRGEVVMGSFNCNETREQILASIAKYKSILTERRYTLHLFIDATEVKVLDVEMATL